MAKKPRLGRASADDLVTEHMAREFASLRPDHTVGEALAALRTERLAEKIVYFYVVDASGTLRGVVPTRRLLMSEPGVPVGSIMIPRVIAIPERATVLEACEYFVLHRLFAFPVVDAANRLLGVVDVRLFTDEVFDLAERQSRDDVFQVLGVRLALGKRGSAWDGFRDRFPWLLCNVGGGLACAFLASRFEALLDAAIVLALFVPVVLAVAESVSMQSMTVTVHALHDGATGFGHAFRAARRELATALLLAVACGAVVGAVAWAWKGSLAVALAIGASIAFSVVTACLLGVLLPSAVHALRRDPKIAAGPIVLATADLLTLLFYFNVSGAILAAGAGA